MAAVDKVSHRKAITDRAAALGFDAIGFTRAALTKIERDGLRGYLAAGHHGTMRWMADRAAERGDPAAMWPDAVTVISLGLSYAPEGDPLATLARTDRGNISVYARHRDYHDVIKGKLKHLAQFIASRAGAEVKVFVDTAPVMEKPLARRAGLGWQGKHTNLVSRRHGSWLLLGEIMTTLDLPADAPHADRCGTCTACQAACPTDAFPAPYKLDARRCISYLTIEHDGPIPVEFRTAMGNRIYGCDDCLAVCPWNKFAQAGREQKLAARNDLVAPRLAVLATLDEAGFRALFAGGPVKRIGRNRFARNVAVAIGNSDDPGLLDAARGLAADSDPVVAEAGGWALNQLKNLE
ncbi:tRNA epoxyqueuosine(34) reductase QueG [Acidiphilium sp. AL]|uniref:tRNA epoxyqueuosine(34) reductase QueG n=1 Tax=Acidiphilium sp. AL TaxID=2871704 RepID=UPI0038CF3C90